MGVCVLAGECSARHGRNSRLSAADPTNTSEPSNTGPARGLDTAHAKMMITYRLGDGFSQADAGLPVVKYGDLLRPQHRRRLGVLAGHQFLRWGFSLTNHIWGGGGGV